MEKSKIVINLTEKEVIEVSELCRKLHISKQKQSDSWRIFDILFLKKIKNNSGTTELP